MTLTSCSCVHQALIIQEEDGCEQPRGAKRVVVLCSSSGSWDFDIFDQESYWHFLIQICLKTSCYFIFIPVQEAAIFAKEQDFGVSTLMLLPEQKLFGYR